MTKLLIIILLATFSAFSGQPSPDNKYPEYIFETNKNLSLPKTVNSTDKIEVQNNRLKNHQGNVEAYNTKSNNTIGEVSPKAIENSQALVSCTQYPDLCTNSKPFVPSPTPIPSPRPTIIIPTVIPEPTIIPKPTIIPEPTPPICIQSEMVCPMIACVDGSDESRVVNGCGCPCYPYSWKQPIIEVD